MQQSPNPFAGIISDKAFKEINKKLSALQAKKNGLEKEKVAEIVNSVIPILAKEMDLADGKEDGTISREAVLKKVYKHGVKNLPAITNDPNNMLLEKMGAYINQIMRQEARVQENSTSKHHVMGKNYFEKMATMNIELIIDLLDDNNNKKIEPAELKYHVPPFVPPSTPQQPKPRQGKY